MDSCKNIIFNNIILIVILLVPLFVNADSQYYRHLILPKDSLFLKSQGDSLTSLVLEARVSVNKNKERSGFSKSSWKLFWNYTSENNYNYIELKWRNTNYGDILDQRQLIVNIGKNINGKAKLIKSVELEKGINLYTGENTILLEVNDDKCNVFIGEDNLQHIGTYLIGGNLKGKCGIESSVDANIIGFYIKPTFDVKKKLETSYTEQLLIDKFLVSSNNHEGFWNYLDRDNDPKLARLGGRYRFALVESNGGYLIIYISGAQTNLTKWSQGMIKGKLIPTIFENHYDLIWYDSIFDVINTEAFATIDGSILTLNFPLYKSSIRFYKERN